MEAFELLEQLELLERLEPVRLCKSRMSTSLMSLTLAQSDPEIAAAIANETERQAHGLELIASENFVSSAVLEAAGSVMTNKYAEG